MTSHDTKWMRRAVRLAQRGEGRTRPNPPVGAVVVKGGRVIGEGFHAYAGGPHAEVAALDACRTSPRGATLYVTLEPCSTTGRTPPCTDRIIRDGIARVVIGAPDPNPRNAGGGVAQLAAAGIEVTSQKSEVRSQKSEVRGQRSEVRSQKSEVRGQREEVRSEKSEVRSQRSEVRGQKLDAKSNSDILPLTSDLSLLTSALIAPFAKHVTTGLPFVTLKLALTLDGRLADTTGASKWITGEKARREVQLMRRRADAVMVGAGTVCADNPSLLCRYHGGDTGGGGTPPSPMSPPSPSPLNFRTLERSNFRTPPPPLLRVIVDASGRTPPTSQVYTDGAAAQTIVATTPPAAERMGGAWAEHGARVWTFPPDRNGRIPLPKLLKRLGKEGLLHVLCEGGGQLAESLRGGGLVDEYCLFYAPLILGGAPLHKAPRMHITQVRRTGQDLMVRVRS